MSKYAVVYASDSNAWCIDQLAISAHTVRTFLDNVDIILLTDSPDADFDMVDIDKVIDVRDIVKKYGLDSTDVKWRGHSCPPMMLIRLAIPLIRELSVYEKVLYLDNDTEIWSKDAVNLFKADIQGYEILGIRDRLVADRVRKRIDDLESKGYPRPGKEYYQRWIELYSTGSYVNSGVLVFNMPAFQSEFYEDLRLKMVVKELNLLKPYYPDQDVINIFYKIKVVYDRKYNCWAMRIPSNCVLFHNVSSVRRRSDVYPPYSEFRPVDELYAIKQKQSLGIFSGYVDSAYVTDTSYGDDTARLLVSYGVSTVNCITEGEIPTYEYLSGDGSVRSNRFSDYDKYMFVRVYAAVKKAYQSGARKTLFIDARHAGSITSDIIRQYLPSLGIDYDLAIFDARKCPTLNTWIAPDNSKRSCDVETPAVYMMSRRCMRHFLWYFDILRNEDTSNCIVRPFQRWLNKKHLYDKRIYYTHVLKVV